MKCYLAEDLLQNYIDGLLRKETEEELQDHLQQCSNCQQLHAQLIAAPQTVLEVSQNKQSLGLWKKFKRRMTRRTTYSIIIITAVLLVCAYFFAIGTLTKSKNFIYEAKVIGELWQIDMDITNGMSLLPLTETLYGEENEFGSKPIIGHIIKPKQLVPSPLLESGNSGFLFGVSLHHFANPDYKVIVRLADQDIIFMKENLE
ncbi:anti-sigma factor family protein [Paenibacillus yanchengensis]|uniref:Anti-sigma-W factor RsiW n=1 Tax=Paenibacillus yanchengensis TaxID=2035833 RepID=A0ABW4YNY0_9BACL